MQIDTLLFEEIGQQIFKNTKAKKEGNAYKFLSVQARLSTLYLQQLS